MFCPNCGAQLPDGAQFCANCGAQLGSAPSAPPTQQSVQQPAYQQPIQQAPPQQYAARIPWHSRGRLSPEYPGRKRITLLFIAALTVLQVVLFLFFSVIGDTAEEDMLTAQLVGFVPTVVLIVYLFCLDTIEKEPPLLLLKLFLIEGVLTMLVVGYVELALISVEGMFLDEDTVLYHLIENIFCVALVEEGFKYFVLKKNTWKHPAFNYRFDGVVYAAVTALGFAAFENFSYVASYGFATALIRTISAVPGHCVDGILMGIFYGKAKLLEARGDHAGSRRNLFLSLLAPIAEHGFYDFFANVEGDAAYLIFYAYIFILNATVFTLVWRLAQQDEEIYQQQQYAAWQ